MSSFWCELAWLGGETPERGVVIEVDRMGSVANVTAGVEVPPADADVLSGLVIPGIAERALAAFQRALRGRTEAAGGGSFWTWREQMYALAQRLSTPSWSGPWHARRSARWRSQASRWSASSTTSTTPRR